MKIIIEFEGSAKIKKNLEDLKKKCSIEELKKKIPTIEEVREKIETGARCFVDSVAEIADKAIEKAEDFVDERLAKEKEVMSDEDDDDYGFDFYEDMFGDEEDDFESSDVEADVAPKTGSVTEEVAKLEELLGKYPDVGKNIIENKYK